MVEVLVIGGSNAALGRPHAHNGLTLALALSGALALFLMLAVLRATLNKPSISAIQ